MTDEEGISKLAELKELAQEQVNQLEASLKFVPAEDPRKEVMILANQLARENCDFMSLYLNAIVEISKLRQQNQELQVQNSLFRSMLGDSTDE